MERNESLVNISLRAGAYKAHVIPTDRIPFDENLRRYCEADVCGNYGKNYACPPGIGEAGTLIGKAREYKKALVFQTVTPIEDSFDFEGMKEAASRHSRIAAIINGHIKKRYDDHLQLTAGECTVCPVCAQVDDKPCRFPDKAVSSLEAYCMDVSALAGLCDMKYTNGKNTVTYFGAFLLNGK